MREHLCSLHNFKRLLVIFLILVLCGSVFIGRTSSQAKPGLPKALIVPHHDLILSLFPSFYESVPEEVRLKITTLYVLSPNHYHPEDTHVVMKDNDQALSLMGVVRDESRFHEEHGVNLQLPFIARYFPHTKVIPLLFTRYVSNQELNDVLRYLMRKQTEDTVFFLASVDFSHYLPYNQSTQKDQETWQLITGKDPNTIRALTDDNLDCPDCVYLIQSLRLAQGARPSLVFHANSAKYMSLSPDAPTTSYFVITW